MIYPTRNPCNAWENGSGKLPEASKGYAAAGGVRGGSGPFHDCHNCHVRLLCITRGESSLYRFTLPGGMAVLGVMEALRRFMGCWFPSGEGIDGCAGVGGVPSPRKFYVLRDGEAGFYGRKRRSAFSFCRASRRWSNPRQLLSRFQRGSGEGRRGSSTSAGVCRPGRMG